jgi:hypothetical protein
VHNWFKCGEDASLYAVALKLWKRVDAVFATIMGLLRRMVCWKAKISTETCHKIYHDEWLDHEINAARQQIDYSSSRIIEEVLNEVLERYRAQQEEINHLEKLLQKGKRRASCNGECTRRHAYLSVFCDYVAKQSNYYYYSTYLNMVVHVYYYSS